MRVLMLCSLLFVAAFALGGLTGCANADPALLEKTHEFNDVDRGMWKEDRRADLPADVIAKVEADFDQQAKDTLPESKALGSGEALRQACIAIINKNRKVWIDHRKEGLPATYVEIRLGEFDSQVDLLKGKGR